VALRSRGALVGGVQRRGARQQAGLCTGSVRPGDAHELDPPRSYRTILICDSFGIGGHRNHDRLALRRIFDQLEPDGALHLQPAAALRRPGAGRMGTLAPADARRCGVSDIAIEGRYTGIAPRRTTRRSSSPPAARRSPLGLVEAAGPRGRAGVTFRPSRRPTVSAVGEDVVAIVRHPRAFFEA
jgi:hypothetical protein